MLSIHATYNNERLALLKNMFDGDPRRGNMALYIREHFDLKRICEACGKRTTANRLAVASAIIQGPNWVLPISLHYDGSIEIDLESSIPNQSNFLAPHITDSLIELGITFTLNDIEYMVPLAEKQADVSVPQGVHCGIISDASPGDILKWDTEVEYDYERYCAINGYEVISGYNVQTEYFQSLAEQGQLVLARVSDDLDRTLGMAYCVPEHYQLHLIKYKWQLGGQSAEVPAALLSTLVHYIHENDLVTPLNLGSRVDPYMDLLHPIQVVKQRLEISNRVSRQMLLDCFGSR